MAQGRPRETQAALRTGGIALTTKAGTRTFSARDRLWVSAATGSESRSVTKLHPGDLVAFLGRVLAVQAVGGRSAPEQAAPGGNATDPASPMLRAGDTTEAAVPAAALRAPDAHSHVDGLLRVAWSSVLVLLLAGAASAAPFSMIDFNIASSAGSLHYAGGSTPLVGSGIAVASVVGLPGSSDQPCMDCVLSFTTGNLTGTDPNAWFFGGGGSLTLTGGIPVFGIPNGTTLLSGTFSSAEVLAFGSFFRIAVSSFADTKDATLQQAFFPGTPAGIRFNGGFNIGALALGAPPNAFTSDLTFGGDLVNVPEFATEPGAVLLFGSGLLGFGYLAVLRRRRGPAGAGTAAPTGDGLSLSSLSESAG